MALSGIIQRVGGVLKYIWYSVVCRFDIGQI